MFNNKHVIVAMLVAPALAVLTWFAVDSVVGKEPRPARAGESYPLVERSNCRYDSGQCDLDNKDFKLTLSLDFSIAKPTLILRSSHALDGALLAVARPGGSGQPSAMRPRSAEANEWTLMLASVPARGERLHLVASAGGTSWFADTGTRFLERHRSD